MRIIDEIKISMFKPHLYYTMKDKSLKSILTFDLITASTGFIYFMLFKLITGIFTGKSKEILHYYLSYGLLNIILSIAYMCLGLMVAALVLCIFFVVINKFKHVDYMSFHNMYNYATHLLLICVFMGTAFGPFVILFAVGYYLMALKGEKLGAKHGVNPGNYFIK